MNTSESSPKRRKLDIEDNIASPRNDNNSISSNLKLEVCVTSANSTTSSRDLTSNTALVSRFLERLKLRTIPLVTPLITRLSVAETKNAEALTSIEKLNTYIKKVECQFNSQYNSNEHRKFDEQSSLAVNKVDLLTPSVNSSSKVKFSKQSKQKVINTKRKKTASDVQKSLSSFSLRKIEEQSAQFLPAGPTTNLLSNPRLSLTHDGKSIKLQWDMPIIEERYSPTTYEMCSFERFNPSDEDCPWGIVGEVASVPPPVICTLDCAPGRRRTYFFAVRAWLNKELVGGWSNVVTVDID